MCLFIYLIFFTGAHIGPEPTTDRFVVITVSLSTPCQINFTSDGIWLYL